MNGKYSLLLAHATKKPKNLCKSLSVTEPWSCRLMTYLHVLLTAGQIRAHSHPSVSLVLRKTC